MNLPAMQTADKTAKMIKVRTSFIVENLEVVIFGGLKQLYDYDSGWQGAS